MYGVRLTVACLSDCGSASAQCQHRINKGCVTLYFILCYTANMLLHIKGM